MHFVLYFVFSFIGLLGHFLHHLNLSLSCWANFVLDFSHNSSTCVPKCKSIGSMGFLPYIRRYELNPVELLLVQLYVFTKVVIVYLTHSFNVPSILMSI